MNSFLNYTLAEVIGSFLKIVKSGKQILYDFLSALYNIDLVSEEVEWKILTKISFRIIMKFQNPKATLLQECSSQSSQRTATLQRPNRPSQPPPPPPKATLHIDPKGSNFYEVPTRLASQTTATDQEDRISWKFDDFDSGNKRSMRFIWSLDSDMLLSK